MKLSFGFVTIAWFLWNLKVVSAIKQGLERKLNGPYGDGETGCAADESGKGSKGKGGRRNGNGGRILRRNGTKGSKKCGKGKGSKDEDADADAMTLFFDTDATPNAIFGSGNDNGFFTCLREDGLELCLRAKQRFPRANPTGLWSQGDGTYIVPNGDPCATSEPGFSFLNGYCVSTPIWSFEWSINSDLDGAADGRNLDAFQFELGMDADPSCDTDFDILYPFDTTLAVPFWDHSFGTSTTTQGGGTSISATSLPDPTTAFNDLVAASTVVQQSWNYEFFNTPGSNLFFFDPNTVGTYDIYLKASTGGECPSDYQVTIQIITDPTQTLYDGSDPTP